MARVSWQNLKPILMQALGYTFLVLGVLGMFLPILQGFLFLFIGLIILARYADWARRLLDAIRARHPKFDHMIGQAEIKAHAWNDRAQAQLRSWLRWAGLLRPARKQCPGRPDP
jgi:uncharacterized membrane protein YbaN (DUF454 family)